MSKRSGKHESSALCIVAAIGAALAAACAPLPSIPMDGTTDLAVTNVALGRELALAADEWARGGLEIANYLTVNQEAHAAPASLVSRERLVVECHLDEASDSDGCVWYTDGHLHGMFIADDLTPARLAVVVRHELIHLLVPRADHLPDGGPPAIFSANGIAAHEVTRADILHVAKYADVTLVQEWPASVAH